MKICSVVFVFCDMEMQLTTNTFEFKSFSDLCQATTTSSVNMLKRQFLLKNYLIYCHETRYVASGTLHVTLQDL